MIVERPNPRPGDVAVLRVEGEYDASNVASFSDEVDGLIHAGCRALVLDLRDLRFADSVMMGRLLRVRDSLRRLGGDLVLLGPTGFVRRTLDVLGFDEILRIAGSRTEALGMLRSPPGGPPGGGFGDGSRIARAS